MAQTLTTTTTTTTEVKLKPALKRVLQVKLDAYAKMHEAEKVAKAAKERLKKEITELFEKNGEFGALQQGVKQAGFTVKHSSGRRSTLDVERLLEQGITTAQIANATWDKPTKASTKVWCPGEKEE